MTVDSPTADRSSYREAEPAAKVIAAEGFYGVGGWVEQPKDARDVKGLKGLRGLPIGTLLYPHPAAQAAEIEALLSEQQEDYWPKLEGKGGTDWAGFDG